MLFSNISIWELNCYKWEGRQGENVWQNTVYFIFISNKGLLLKAFMQEGHIMGNFTLWALHSEGNFLEIKLFLTCFRFDPASVYFQSCTQFSFSFIEFLQINLETIKFVLSKFCRTLVKESCKDSGRETTEKLPDGWPAFFVSSVC